MQTIINNITIPNHFRIRRWFGIVILMVCILPAQKLQATNSSSCSRVIEKKNSTIIIAASDSSQVIIREGSIIATEGKSIRFLPGTKIKATKEGQLTVSISDKEHQEALAEAIAKEKEEEMLTLSSKICQSLAIETTFELNTKIRFPFTLPNTPHNLTSAFTNITAVHTGNNVKLEPTEVELYDLINTNLQTQQVSEKKYTYVPLYTWGTRSETIKVLRC